MRNWNWPMIGFFALMTGLVLIGTIGHLEPILCNTSQLQKSAAQQNTVVFTCFEFWLNRYQGLIGGFLALIGAAATVIVVRYQIAVQNDNAARTARVIAISSLRRFYMEGATRIFQLLNVEEVHSDVTYVLPRLSIDDRPDILAALGPQESEKLYAFGADIEFQRSAISELINIAGEIDDDDYKAILAGFIYRSAKLIDRLNNRVGWKKFKINDDVQAVIDLLKEQELFKAAFKGSHP